MARHSCEFCGTFLLFCFLNKKGITSSTDRRWFVLLNEENEIKKKRGVDLHDCISSPIYKRTVKRFKCGFCDELSAVLLPAVVSHSCPLHVSSPHLPLAPPLFGSSGVLELTTMQLCNTNNCCLLLTTLSDLTDAELCKSNQFYVIRNFRLLHTRRLEAGEQNNLFLFLRYGLYNLISGCVCLLTSLKVTFTLLWGSSTIFCKLAATTKMMKEKKRVESEDQLMKKKKHRTRLLHPSCEINWL